MLGLVLLRGDEVISIPARRPRCALLFALRFRGSHLL